MEKGEEFTPRDTFYYSNELKDHRQFEKAIQYYHKFLDMEEGWIEDKIQACIYLAACYRQLNDLEGEIDALVKSIIYDVPRPEVSCRLGDLYLERELYDKAILWYQLAIQVNLDDRLGFRQESYATWYPYLQLCVCHWYRGDLALSAEYNKKAKEYRPDDQTILKNKVFFDQYFEKKPLE